MNTRKEVSVIRRLGSSVRESYWVVSSLRLVSETFGFVHSCVITVGTAPWWIVCGILEKLNTGKGKVI